MTKPRSARQVRTPRPPVRPGTWLIAFTLTLIASSAAPVFATGEGGGEGEETRAPSSAEIAELESQELEYAEWLSSAEAVAQREASRKAYGGLSASEARELILEAFPGQLDALNADPARVLTDLEIEKSLGTHAALVSDQQGERSIVESSVPVESELGGEGTQPVDLSLEQSGSDFVSQNPLTEVRLPSSAEEPIQLQSELEIELPSDNDHSAQGLGDKNLFYPATETTTDTLVSPIAAGVEVFEQLRSPESPEEFLFDLELPDSTTLRATEVGGAEIVSSSGDTIGQVPPPNAVDAQGASVPVEMNVEGSSLLLEVPHGSDEFAYPILLDPQFLEEGYVAYGKWAPSWNDAYGFSNVSSLSVTAKGGGYTYGANTYGQWVYTAPGQSTYIAAATFFSNTFTLPSNCATEQPTNQPHGYAGLYNPSTNGYVGLGHWSGGSSFSSQYQTGWVGGPGVRQAMVGIGTGTTSVHHKCAFTFSVGGVTIQEKDPEAPTIDWVSGTSSKWVKDLTVTAHASDPGLGVKAITLSPGGALPHTNDAGCTGAYNSRCDSSYETSFGVGYFAEGERSASISAYDPLGPDDGAHVSSSYQWTTKLDRSKPEVALEGQLAEAIEEAESEGEVSEEEVPQLSLPVYNLKIEAKDGNKAEGKTKRSGVKNISVFVDGKEMEVPWASKECPESSCSRTETYSLRLNGLEGGPVHHLKAVAEDQVGNQREDEIEFEYIPATGMKDEYVMQYFPLPDGQGNEDEEEHPSRPELAVNVVSGNLVYRQKDVDVEGPAVDLEVERFYNSQLPYEDGTEWGRGWTLAQTPELEPEETKEEVPPAKASMRRTSGVFESAVGLPTKSGDKQFDKELQAVVTKEPGGDYTVADQSGETDTSLVFDDSGKVKELQTSGYARIDYSYENGDLSEMAVDDPTSAYLTPEQLEELRNEPSEWTTQATVSPETRTELNLTDVSCTSATKCMAVGYNKFLGQTFAESWDGSDWKIARSNLGTVVEPSVSCVGLTSCHIVGTSVGAQGTWILSQSGEVSNWNNTFRAFAVPEGASNWKLRDVSCSSETACTAVGFALIGGQYKTLVERYNGSSWSVQKGVEPSQGNGYRAMSGVSCASSTRCMAVGEAAGKPFAEEWDGAKWTLVSIPEPATGFLEDVSCVSATSCIAVGHHGAWEWMGWLLGSSPLAESWDGSEWSEIETPEPSEELSASGGTLSAVSCASASSCVAAGNFFTKAGVEGDEEKTLAEVWDGAEWTVQPSTSPDTFSTFAGIGCTVTTQCVAVGSARPANKDTNNMVTLGEGIKLPPIPSTEDDPKVEVEVSSGLVDSVEGEEAGQTTYTHEADSLVAVDGPEGETEYEYDSNERLTKVTLPNGSWGKIAYSEVDGRVKSVTVDPAGEGPAKTTYFTYQDSPSRRTTVSPEGEPATVYDIAPDGSVLKSWNALKAPEIEVSGSLYEQRGELHPEPIAIGDHDLVVKAHSEEGIASIQVIANGDLLVDEKTCAQDYSNGKTECVDEATQWVTDTGGWAPGILQLEVIVTDSLSPAQVSSERFWVNIPYTPPPEPGAAEPPEFDEVLAFREEHGLDLDLKGNELATNERIFDLLNAWYNPNTPAGEVARATEERWGVPLRPVDAAELDWRLQYWEQASAVIPSWAAANAPSTFAGYYLDERAGGKIVIGFTGGQAGATFSALEQNAGLIAGADRIEPMTPTPTHTLASLEALQPQVSAASGDYPPGLINSIRTDVPSNRIEVGASDVSQAQSLLQGSFGAGAPIAVHLDRIGRERKDARQRIVGQVRAGDELMMFYPKEDSNEPLFYGPCTAAFGAFERAKNPATGNSVLRMFALTAAHCAGLEKPIIRRRASKAVGAEQKKIGEVTRWGWKDPAGPGLDPDAAAIRLDNPNQTPRWINQDEHLPGIRVTSVWSPTVGTSLCFSGRSSEEKRCGPVISGAEILYDEIFNVWTREMCFAALTWGGDSGSPVWVEGTGAAVGILTTGSQDPNEPGWKSEFEVELKEEGFTSEEIAEVVAEEETLLREEPEACFNLLKAPPGGNGGGTVFGDNRLSPLHLVTVSNAQP
jgi:YD repeat-containing protein